MSKKENKITIRMNEEEFAILKEKARMFDGNVSKFARFCIDSTISEKTVPKDRIMWFIQKVLSDPELRKNQKLAKYMEELFKWL